MATRLSFDRLFEIQEQYSDSDKSGTWKAFGYSCADDRPFYVYLSTNASRTPPAIPSFPASALPDGFDTSTLQWTPIKPDPKYRGEARWHMSIQCRSEEERGLVAVVLRQAGWPRQGGGWGHSNDASDIEDDDDEAAVPEM